MEALRSSVFLNSSVLVNTLYSVTNDLFVSFVS